MNFEILTLRIMRKQRQTISTITFVAVHKIFSKIKNCNRTIM